MRGSTYQSFCVNDTTLAWQLHKLNFQKLHHMSKIALDRNMVKREFFQEAFNLEISLLHSSCRAELIFDQLRQLRPFSSNFHLCLGLCSSNTTTISFNFQRLKLSRISYKITLINKEWPSDSGLFSSNTTTISFNFSKVETFTNFLHKQTVEK